MQCRPAGLLPTPSAALTRLVKKTNYCDDTRSNFICSIGQMHMKRSHSIICSIGQHDEEGKSLHMHAMMTASPMQTNEAIAGWHLHSAAMQLNLHRACLICDLSGLEEEGGVGWG